jgi:hypothetical protein
MPVYTGDYQYMYNVTVDGGGSPTSGSKFDVSPGSPAATSVKFKDTSPTVSPTDDITVKSAGHGLNGLYEYIGSVKFQGGEIGYIVENANTGSYYLMTDTAVNFAKNLTTTGLDTHGANSELPACFVEGTLIRTPSGEVKVEDLSPGDMVMTAGGQPAPVCWIGKRTVARPFVPEFSLPVRVKAGALDENVPSHDLLLSPDHALLVEDVLVQAGALINGTSVTRDTEVPKTFTYYHVELADHSLIFAENTPAETFVDNVDRMGFDNWHEYEALYPDGKAIAEMSYPRAKSARQVPQAIRAKLSERGIARFGNAAASAA